MWGWRLTDAIRARASVDAVVVGGAVGQAHPSVFSPVHHIWHFRQFNALWHFHVIWFFWLRCTGRVGWAAWIGVAGVAASRRRHLVAGSFPTRMREAAVPGDVTSSQADFARAVPDFRADVSVRTICVRITPDRAMVLKVNHVTVK